MLTQEKLKHFLHYDPDTGVFTWLRPRATHIKPGDTAGSIRTGGYIAIGLNGRLYQAHRLAWLYVYGELDDCEIDHINGLVNDNRIANIRIATISENRCNSRRRKDNKSGYKGVDFHKSSGKFRARIQVRGKAKSLGRFYTAEEAYAARCKAALELHGEFANGG